MKNKISFLLLIILLCPFTNFCQVNSVVKREWFESPAVPWIISLIIAVLTVIVNISISNSSRKTSLKTVQTQIESSLKLASLQYQATLYSNNRQAWIDSIRDCLSSFLTNAKLLNIEYQEPVPDRSQIKIHYEKVNYNRSKLSLLLNPKIQEGEVFLKSLEELITVLEKHFINHKNKTDGYDNLDFIQKNDKVIELGRLLVYSQWEKIQNAFQKS